MFENKRYLPYSGRRYLISATGEVFSTGGEQMRTEKRDNEVCVEIDWVLGRKSYQVAVLVMTAFDFLKIQDHLIDEVVPLYRDGSPTNLTPSNLLYKFKSGKIEVENHPGFYYIPFYTEYAINKDGELINIETGKFKSWSVTKPSEHKNQTGGYLYSRVINDLGFSKTLFQHRALCYVFKDYGGDVESLVTNHIDGNPGNNSIDNIELVTYQRNNIHAVEIGLRGDNKPVLSRNLETGEILRFESILACGRHYGQPKAGFVVHRLAHGSGKVYPDMLQFKFDDGKDWPVVDITKIQRIGKAEDIVARNVFTGDLVIFEGAPQGLEITGVKTGTILTHVRENKIIPVNGWNFRWLGPNIIWPEHTERHLRVYMKFPIYPPDGAIVYDTVKDEELFFESVAMACQNLKITKSTFYHHASTDKLLSKRYKLELFNLRKSLGLPTEKSVEK